MPFYELAEHSWQTSEQNDRQIPFLLDARGGIIRFGAKVVVNVSGELGVGRVVVVPHGTRPYRRNIRVELQHSTGGQRPGHISKIRNERALLVLQEGES